MKNSILLFALLLLARLSSAQNPADTSCYFWISATPNSGGGAWLVPQTPDSNDVASVIWNTGQTDYYIGVTDAGTYCATVTMNDGCSSVNCLYWAPPSPCSVEIYEDSLGNLSAVSPGWNPPYFYNWSNGSSSQNIQSGGPGLNYCVTVVDGTGCVAMDCISTTYGDCSVWVSVSVDTTVGEITLTANANGTAPFTYNWSNGAATPQVVVQPNAGLVGVTITDATGCESTSSYQVNQANCSVQVYQFANSVRADFYGWGPATYLWNTGETTHAIFPQTSGTYCVTVSNPFGCTATGCQLFIGNPPPGCDLTAKIVADPTSGYFKLTALPENGTAPFIFHWKYGQNSQYSASGQTPAHLEPFYFPYLVTVTDANGCTATAEFSDETCLLSVTYELVGNSEYKVKISPTGAGFVWYSTSDGWVGGGTGNGIHTRTVTTPGNYCVTMTDEAGCQQETCVELPACAVSLGFAPDSSILASFSGGQPTSIVWSDPSLSGLNVTPAGNFTWLAVQVSDGVCTATDTIYSNAQANLPKFVTIQKALVQPDGVRLIALASQPENVNYYVWNLQVTTREIEVNVPGTYCVTVFYKDGRSVSDCYDLELNTGVNVKVGFGIVGQHDQRFGDLWLIQYDPAQGGILTAVDTVPFNQSLGVFENVAPGEYLIKASVSDQSTLYEDYIPTYFMSTLLWENALPLDFSHPFGQNFVFLPLIKGQNPGGPGFVGGLVSQGANLQAGSLTEFFGGNPLPGICILLTLPNGTAVAHAVTDAAGKFEFPNLAYGTYQVWVDIPGLDPVFKVVTIGPANPSVSTLSVLVDEDSANFSGTTSSPEISGFSEIEIYPNPANGEAFLSLEIFAGQAVRVSVLNPMGQLVLEKTPEKLNSPILAIDVSAFSAGQYFVVVETGEGERLVGKLAVQRF